jgi:1-pyrroline-5-carboxylate dehydrogenase
MGEKNFRLTYATMYNPPEELHTKFEAEVAKIKANLGQEFGMLIDGKDVFADEKFEDRSPINTDLLLGVFQKGTEKHAEMALQAARQAAKGWADTDWRARVAQVRAAAARMDARIYELGAVIS